MFTMGLATWQSISQPPGLSAVSRPYHEDKLHQTNNQVNPDAAVWPIQTQDGRLLWPADMPGYRNTEPGLESPLVDPIDIAVAPIGATSWGGRALAMAAEPAIAYGADKALGALLGMFQRGKDSNLHTPVWAAQHFTASMPQIEDWYRQAYGGLIGEMERSK
jgi:hypothetical protein